MTVILILIIFVLLLYVKIVRLPLTRKKTPTTPLKSGGFFFCCNRKQDCLPSGQLPVSVEISFNGQQQAARNKTQLLGIMFIVAVLGYGGPVLESTRIRDKRTPLCKVKSVRPVSSALIPNLTTNLPAYVHKIAT